MAADTPMIPAPITTTSAPALVLGIFGMAEVHFEVRLLADNTAVAVAAANAATARNLSGWRAKWNESANLYFVVINL
jgi:hypothetical protein